MQYLLEKEISENLQNSINHINQINFTENESIIQDETYIISLEDAKEFYDGRINTTAERTFGITQSLMHNENQIHLIVINEGLCTDYNANLTAIILHELGHIVNEYGKKLNLMDALRGQINPNDIPQRNDEIALENEYHADYFAKEYGFSNETIQVLTNSIGNGFDDDELRLRIQELENETVRLSNRVRSHNL